MRRLMAGAALLLTLAGVGGCAWQANSGSQAVTINPLAAGSEESVFSPSNGPGYMNGEALDMRTKR